MSVIEASLNEEECNLLR